MPCYDGRENERQVLVSDEHQAKLRTEWTHNSPVAELLCTVMKQLEREGDAPYTLASRYCRNNPKLAKWWSDHQKRDAGRKKK